MKKIQKHKENNKNEKKFNIKDAGTSAVLKIILILFLVVSIIFIGARTIGGVTLTSFMGDIKIFFSSLGWGSGYPCELTGSSAQQIYTDGKKVFVFSDDKTVLLSTTAKKLSEIPIEYGNPSIRYENGRACIFDRDSGKLKIQSTSQIITEKEAENKILTATIGKKGNYADVTALSSTKSKVTAYNKQSKEVFSWTFENEKVTDIDLSDDGKYAVVSTIWSKNAVINSKVYVFKFDSKDYVSCFDLNSSAVVNVRYDNAHNITVVSNTGRAYIKDNDTLCEVDGFESHILFKCSESKKKYSAVALKKYGGDNYGTVKIYKKDKLVFTADTTKEIKDVFCTEKYTAVLTTNRLLIYKNKNGKLAEALAVDAAITEVVIKNRTAYLMTPSSVSCQKF